MIRILFICSGNLCRSPMAQALLADLTDGLPVDVGSAGTLKLDGRESPKEVIAAGDRLGVDLREHRARNLSAFDPLGDFDLVIGMAREHMAAAVVDYGARPELTFTLIELVQLLEELYGESGNAEAPATEAGSSEAPSAGDASSETPAAAVDPEALALKRIRAANDLRGGMHAFAISADVPDPIGGPKRAYESMADTVSDLTRRLARGLFGAEALSSSLPTKTD